MGTCQTGTQLDPAAELGDTISVNGAYSGIYRMDTTFNSNCPTTISAPSDEEIDYEYQYKSKQQREVKRKNKYFSTQLSIQQDAITAEVKERESDIKTVKGSLEVQSRQIVAKVNKVQENTSTTFGWAYKLQSASTWTALTSGSGYTLTSNIISASGAFSVDSSYDIRLTVSDYFTTVTSTYEIPTAFTLLDFNASGKGLAFGKVSEKTNAMEIAMDVEFIGKITGTIFDTILPIGTIIMRYDHTNPGTLYPGTTWVRVYGAFPWFTDAAGQIGTTGGAREVTLTVDQIPSHSHGSVYSQHAPGTKSQAWYTTAGTSLAYGAVATGGGAAHNNMPPYIQISAWRRTA